MSILFFTGYANAEITTPVNKDAYLSGITKIIVWINAPLESEQLGLLTGPNPKISNAYLDLLSKELKAQLENELSSEAMKSVIVQSVKDAHVNPFKILEDNILLVEFSLGFKIEQDNEGLIIGAISPTVWRKPPEQLENQRVSGYHGDFVARVSPSPFIFSINGQVSQASLDSAAQRSAKVVADWINKFHQ